MPCSILPPGQARAPPGAFGGAEHPAAGSALPSVLWRVWGRGRARPGSLPNQSLHRCFACALKNPLASQPSSCFWGS